MAILKTILCVCIYIYGHMYICVCATHTQNKNGQPYLFIPFLFNMLFTILTLSPDTLWLCVHKLHSLLGPPYPGLLTGFKVPSMNYPCVVGL